MKRIALVIMFIFTTMYATEYRVANLKNGSMLNVRDLPLMNARTVVGKIPFDAMGIKIRECRYDDVGREWCYISHLVGAEYLEGWVNRKFLEPMSEEEASAANITYIKSFLNNFYMSEEKNFLDKLQIFYYFPMQQYMSTKNVTHLALRTEKVVFYKRWPRRSYDLGTVSILKRQPDYLDVKATVYWRHDRGSDYEKGKDIHKIRLVRNENRLKILAIKPLSHIVYPKPIEVEEENATITDGNKTAMEQYYIKIGSFVETPNDIYFKKISDLGFTYTIETFSQSNTLYHRVYIGPFHSTIDATNVLDAVHQNINPQAYIETRRN